MPVVCQQVELMVRVNQRRASLPDVLAEVARWGCNVLAYCSYADREEFVVLLVADDPAVAKRGLEGRGFTCKANPVVLVRETDSVGAAANLGFHLSRSGIDILYSYASSSGSDEFWAVFKTTDDDRAIRVLSATERRRDVA